MSCCGFHRSGECDTGGMAIGGAIGSNVPLAVLYTDSTGNLASQGTFIWNAATSTFSIMPDDATNLGIALIGRARIASISDTMYLGHVDHTAATAAGFSQTAAGIAIVNVPTGQTGRLAVNGSSVVLWSSVALAPAVADRTLGVIGTPWGDFYTKSFWEGVEMTAPAAPAANKGRVFFQDNGAGKTQMMVIFASGAAQQIAIEP